MESAVGYFRTSSSTNVGENKDSEQRQRAAVETYAKNNRLEIEKSFYDAGVKGKDSLLQRKGFRELLKYCEQTGVRTILVENASRFARDLIVQETGFQYLQSLGFTLISVDSPKSFIEDSPTSVMVRQILGAVSQFAKDEIVSKLAVARERKKEVNKKQGIVTLDGNGKCGGRKSLKERHPELVKIARRLYRRNPLSGKRRSLREVGRILFDDGYKNMSGGRIGTDQIKWVIG